MNKAIIKKSKSKAGKHMASIPVKDIKDSMKVLSDGAYKLLMYYYSCSDGWRFNEDTIAATIGTSTRQVKKFRKELVDHEYLLIQRGSVDVYFVGKLAVAQFKDDTYIDVDDEDIAKEPIATRSIK